MARGGPGDDRVFGGNGQGGVDRVFGREGNDDIQTDQQTDVAIGEVVLTKEVIRYGPGFDTVFFDEGVDMKARPAACKDKSPIPSNARAAEGALWLPFPLPSRERGAGPEGAAPLCT